MENTKSEPTVRRRKKLMDCKLKNISYEDLYQLYVKECKLKNLADVTIKKYGHRRADDTETT